ncbi:MAG: HlyD family efflux transporter periplasmic adaptor subunit [Flammeovirgaceae bacterium]
MKKENDIVEQGDIIACVKSNVRMEDILTIEKVIANDGLPKQFDENLKLGELQSYFNELIKNENDLEVFKQNDLAKKQVGELESQIQSYQLMNANLRAQQKIQQHELSLSYEKFLTDSTLYAQKVIAKTDYNSALSSYLSQQRNAKNTEVSIINNKIQINQMHKQVSELIAGKVEKENQLLVRLKASRDELTAQIRKWKETNLFLSPIDGEVAYLGYLQNLQFVENGKALFLIIPTSGNIFGLAELPISGSGKVMEGQVVNIRLQNYPYEQFGILSGVIESLSPIPNQNQYIVKIALPKGMVSSYKRELPFHQQLQGETEIITEDYRLLERFFYQMKKITTR